MPMPHRTQNAALGRDVRRAIIIRCGFNDPDLLRTVNWLHEMALDLWSLNRTDAGDIMEVISRAINRERNAKTTPEPKETPCP